MKVDKYLLVALIYFFFNSFALPEGFTYTFFMTPLFYWYIYKNGGRQIELKFLVFLLPFLVVHLFQGVVLVYYLKSLVLLVSGYLFGYAVYHFFKKYQRLEWLFSRLLLFNFVFVLIAIGVYFTPAKESLWTVRHLTREIQNFPRLELLTYEPSYYSSLLVPIILYFITKMLFKPYPIRVIVSYSVLLLVPLLLSFSLGVIATLAITLLLFFIFHFKRLIHKQRIFVGLSTLVVVGVIGLFALLIAYPDNPLFKRISNLFTGKDSSGQGRTTDAMMLAYLIAKEKSLWFGAGLGQIKILGETVIREYYHYAGDDIRITRIPSAVGETLGTFGLLGLVLRLGIQVYLFFKTRVFRNDYRTLIFIYIFLYQLTGSFLTNMAEYVLWIIAFTPCCIYFDREAIELERSETQKTPQVS
ncbi:MAG: O-antigen ligase family protein [Salibacteraceae bacterium]